MTNDPSERPSQLQARAAGYGFLAWLFLVQPDHEFVTRLLAPDVQEGLLSLASAASSDAKIVIGFKEMVAYLAGDGSGSMEATCQALALERTRLLHGVERHDAPPPPYESLYRSPELGGGISVLQAVAEFYREAQVEQSERQVDQIDYLGLELDLMRLLCEEENSCLKRGEADAANGFATLQQRFLQEHLLKWVPQFCELILNYPKAGFYRGVVRFLLGFLEEAALTQAGYPIDEREISNGFSIGI
jgi:putative dimethyl sulfoxide reductase chaperone